MNSSHTERELSRVRTRKPDNGSGWFASCFATDSPSMKVPGAETMSRASPPSTTETVTGVWNRKPAGNSSTRNGTCSARQMPASGLKRMSRY
jgi:hypothetical protein